MLIHNRGMYFIEDGKIKPDTVERELLSLAYNRFYDIAKALSLVVGNEKKTPVVIVDEVHLLSREILEEIRSLLNVRMDSYSALSLILVGQTELRDTL